MKCCKWITSLIFLLAAVTPVAAAQQKQNIYASSANADAQRTQKVEKGTPLAQVLRLIEDKYNVHILYNSGLVAGKTLTKPRELHFKRNIYDLLDELLPAFGFTYKKLTDRTLGVVPKQEVFPMNNIVQETISGTVTDSSTGNPLLGVNILVKGTSIGTATNKNGRYSLSVPSLQDTLMFSYIGYKTRQVPIGGRTQINVTLRSQALSGQEMVVVGYGTQQKNLLTSSVSTVSGSNLAEVPAANLGNALAGKVAGLQSIQYSGQPGKDLPQIYLRGVGSLTKERSHPIFVLDGTIVNAREVLELDPTNVENVSVLKDASATAIYGVEGANGAIVVTTKRGQKGKIKVSLSTSAGFQSPTHIQQFAGSYDYARAYNAAQITDGTDPSRVRFSKKALKAFRTHSDPLIYPDVTLVDYVTNPRAFQSRSNINLSGGSKDVQFYISGGYLKQNGFLKTLGSAKNKNPTYNRYNLRSNIDIHPTTSTEISLTAGARIGNRVRKEVHDNPDRLWEDMYKQPPIATAGLVNGKVIKTNKQYIAGNQEHFFYNHFYGKGYNRYLQRTLNLNLSLRQQLTKGLAFRVKGTYDASFTNHKRWDADVPYYVPYYKTDVAPSAGADSSVVFQKYGKSDPLHLLFSRYGKDRQWTAEARLNYNNDFGPHSVKGLLLYKQRKDYYPGPFTGIPRDLVSTVGRVNYSYGNRYLLQFSMGYNGSENFAKGHRFGFFPAVSGGWILTNEPYFPDLSFLSFLKLRASWGRVGNDRGVGRFLYLPTPYNVSDNTYYFGNNSIRNGLPTATEGDLSNPQVTWETAKKQNYGINIRMFKSRLKLSFDYFIENRSNILIHRNTYPTFFEHSVSGIPAVNLGKVHNKGYEAEASWEQHAGNFFYHIGGKLSFARNKIVFTDEVDHKYAYQDRTGHPVGQQFGYIFDRFYEKSDFTGTGGDRKLKETLPQPTRAVQPGFMKFKDLNGDGVIDNFDQKAVGYPRYPEYTFSSDIRFGYKNWDLSMNWAGITHASRLLGKGHYRMPFQPQGRGGIMQWIYDQRWTPEKGQRAGYPRISIAAIHSTRNAVSDFWMRDATYLRLKSAQIGYSFSPKLLQPLGLQEARIYLRGTNLLTFTPLDIVDPEMKTAGYFFDAYPIMKVLSFGVDIKF